MFLKASMNRKSLNHTTSVASVGGGRQKGNLVALESTLDDSLGCYDMHGVLTN
jgi:hypothetical protein